MNKQLWKNLWSSYRYKLAETGSVTMALIWIEIFNADDARLLAQLVLAQDTLA